MQKDAEQESHHWWCSCTPEGDSINTGIPDHDEEGLYGCHDDCPGVERSPRRISAEFDTNVKLSAAKMLEVEVCTN